MTDSRPAVPPSAGPRITFQDGRVRLLPRPATPAGMVPARHSVVSPGTEMRQLYETITGPPRAAGYMNISRDSDSDSGGGWMVAPTPHGAAWQPSPGVLTAPAGTSVEVAALARFQLMAVLGFDRVPDWHLKQEEGAVVVGSGPVALGAALELWRRGVTRITVLTDRRAPLIGRVPRARCTSHLDGRAHLVIDAAAGPAGAMGLLAPGAVLGLLGTPTAATAGGGAMWRRLHREGWTVVGMHELATPHPGRYQDAYATAVEWLNGLDDSLLAGWVRRVPGEQAEALYRSLSGPGRPPQPVLIFDWEGA